MMKLYTTIVRIPEPIMLNMDQAPAFATRTWFQRAQDLGYEPVRLAGVVKLAMDSRYDSLTNRQFIHVQGKVIDRNGRDDDDG